MNDTMPNHNHRAGFTASLMLAAASPLLSPTLAAVVADYNFINIADTTSGGGPYSSFGFLPVAAPAVNNHREVAFFAALDAGGSGIFRGDGAATTTIALTTGPFSGFLNNTPTINDAGTVAFGAGLDVGGSGIFTGSGGGTTTIAATSPGGGSFGSLEGNFGWIDADDVVAFSGDLAGPGGDGIYTGSGGGTTTIADDSDRGPFLSFSNGASISNGTVAFGATLDTGILGIFTGSGRATTPIADQSGPLFGFGVPVINSGGTVAFLATLDAGGAGIFTGSGGPTTPIADTSGPFSFFGFYPSLNVDGTVAFLATLDAGGTGIFTGADPVADKVIRTGDPLFGSTVAALEFFSGGLNDHGDIAFRYELANGVEGIALAVAKSPSEPADLDGDGDVDGFDLALLLGQWTGAASYAPCPPHAPADLNSDCQINGFDLALLLGAWG